MFPKFPKCPSDSGVSQIIREPGGRSAFVVDDIRFDTHPIDVRHVAVPRAPGRVGQRQGAGTRSFLSWSSFRAGYFFLVVFFAAALAALASAATSSTSAVPSATASILDSGYPQLSSRAR